MVSWCLGFCCVQGWNHTTQLTHSHKPTGSPWAKCSMVCVPCFLGHYLPTEVLLRIASYQRSVDDRNDEMGLWANTMVVLWPYISCNWITKKKCDNYVLLPLDCVFSLLSGISLDSNVRYPCGSLLVSLSAALSLDFSAEYDCFDWTLHWTDWCPNCLAA